MRYLRLSNVNNKTNKKRTNAILVIWQKHYSENYGLVPNEICLDFNEALLVCSHRYTVIWELNAVSTYIKDT
jgi:hypothetical protein